MYMYMYKNKKKCPQFQEDPINLLHDKVPSKDLHDILASLTRHF